MAELAQELSSETRQRLLEAAGEVFAEHGFHHATVREICSRANANIAAVNYHFGDKHELYVAVLQYAHSCARLNSPEANDPNATPEDRLREFIGQFLRRLLDPGRPSWHGRLMAREMNEPTAALDMLVEHEIRPRVMQLTQILRDLLGDLPPQVLARCGTSVVAQMLHYHFARPVLNRIWPAFSNVENQLDELADHVFHFSLGGLLAMRDQFVRGQRQGVNA